MLPACKKFPESLKWDTDRRRHSLSQLFVMAPATDLLSCMLLSEQSEQLQ